MVEPNLRIWSGDHCSVYPPLVKGILFSNAKLNVKDPWMGDVMPTILDVYGGEADGEAGWAEPVGGEEVGPGRQGKSSEAARRRSTPFTGPELRCRVPRYSVTAVPFLTRLDRHTRAISHSPAFASLPGLIRPELAGSRAKPRSGRRSRPLTLTVRAETIR